MATSPVIVENDTKELKLTGGKAKSLTVRTMSNGTPRSKPIQKARTGSELAEQLNQDTKERYVKGMLRHPIRMYNC